MSASRTRRTPPARSLGSLAGGFGLLPWLSAPGAWRLVAVVARRARPRGGGPVDAAASAGTPSSYRRSHRRGRPQSRSCYRATGPTAVWRHSGIGAGRAARDVLDVRRISCAHGCNAERRAIVWDGDGVESSVALAAEQTGYAFIVNGKADGSARGDAGTQVMRGLLGAMLHPAAAARAGDRARHRQHRRLARGDSVDGARRRRRARAARRRRRARVRNR